MLFCTFIQDNASYEILFVSFFMQDSTKQCSIPFYTMLYYVMLDFPTTRYMFLVCTI